MGEKMTIEWMIEETIEGMTVEMIEEILGISPLEINIHHQESQILGQTLSQEEVVREVTIPSMIDQGQEINVIQSTILNTIHLGIPDTKKHGRKILETSTIAIRPHINEIDP